MTGSTQTLPGYESPGPLRLPPGNLEPVEEGDSEVEGDASFDSESVYGDMLSNIEEEEEDDDEEGRSFPGIDPVFEKIKESLSRTQRSESALSGISSISDSSDGPHVQISSQYTSVPYGIQARATYEHSSLQADIMGVAYNGRMRQFVILDSKGITTWKRDLVDPRGWFGIGSRGGKIKCPYCPFCPKAITNNCGVHWLHNQLVNSADPDETAPAGAVSSGSSLFTDLKFMVNKDLTPKTFQLNQVRRALQYPKYEYRLIMNIVYAPKYNCYFALGKDFSVKVLNRDFEETCSVNTDMRSILYILFNPVRDELITGGVGGIKIWNFQQVAGRAFTELKPLANYELRIKDTLPNVGGSWVKRVDLDYYLQHLYCCSDTDLHVYDLSGKLLFKFERAHTMTITGCCFSPSAKVLVTSSVDSDVKVWSLTGGLVHTFRGHSRAVTGLLLHPETSSVIITASLDGSVRMWSLDTMDLLYMIVVSADGVMWMGLTDDMLLYISTCRNITLWHLNNFFSFWGLARNQVSHLSLASCEDKTTRVLAVGDDSSVRIFTRSSHKNITTVLPPPDISPLQKVLSVCYSREKNVAFLLITNREIWVYTTRTDPACRIAIWDVHDLQIPYISGDTSKLPPGVIIQPPSQVISTHRATENGHGNEIISNCCSLCILNSTAMMWTDEGLCCPIRHTYLLLGMEDGRILFMDPVIKGQKYMELKASKDAIQDMKHDVDHSCLITQCRLKTLVMIQVWGLPQLDAMYELYCGPDITCFARLGSSLLTGHSSGQVNFHLLEPMEDTGFLKSTQEPPYESIVDDSRRPEHLAGVVAMDSLATMAIYVTCSSDGAIKVWDESKVLMTEVMLEESLSAACFLNEGGDLLVGFKNHIFYIDHSKLCPAFKPPEIEMETSDQESDVYEDPRVLYEILKEDEEPVTLKNYLVPYDHLEFDEDFLEGKTKIEQPKTVADVLEESESETETDVSLAPSSIYMSPAESIESLSMIDLTLGADYTKHDLNAQMKATMNEMVLKAKEEEKWKGLTPARLYIKLRRIQIANAKKSKYVHKKKKGKKHRKHVTIETPGYSDMEEKETELELEKFMLPAFGESPGGSPSITPPSGEATPRRSRHRQEYEDEDIDETREEAIYKEATGFVPIEPDKVFSPSLSERADSASTRTLTPETLKHHSPSPVTKQTIPKLTVRHFQPSLYRRFAQSPAQLNRKTHLSQQQNKTQPVKKLDTILQSSPVSPFAQDLNIPPQTLQTASQSKKKKVMHTVKHVKQLRNEIKVVAVANAPAELDTKQTLQNQSKFKSFIQNKVMNTSPIKALNTSVQSVPQSGLQKSNQNKSQVPVSMSKSPQKPVVVRYGPQKHDSQSAVKVPTVAKPVQPRLANIVKPLLNSSKKEQTAQPPPTLDSETNKKVENPADSNKHISASLTQSSEYSLVLQDLKRELELEEKLRKEQEEKDELESIKAIFEGLQASQPTESDTNTNYNVELETESNVDSGVGSSVFSENLSQRAKSLFAVTCIVDTEDTVTDHIIEETKQESDSESHVSHKDLDSGSETSKGTASTGKKERADYDEDNEEGDEKNKVKGKVVDVRGMIKKKRRVTSGRAPSLTRKASTDHSHDDHDHDHDHGHDDKRTKKEIKKKQMLDERNRAQRIDMSKLINLPPNPPSMLSRKRSLSEARKSFELNLLHHSDHRRDSIMTDLSGGHGPLEDEEMDQIQEQQWAMEATIHGKTLTIPPQKDKHHARIVNQQDKIDPRLQRMRDRKHMLGEREPLEVNTPGIGSSPTAELEEKYNEEESQNLTREITVQTQDTDETQGDEKSTEEGQKEGEKAEAHLDTVTNLDANAPETQMQRAKRLGLKVDTEKVFENEKSDKGNAVPRVLVRRSKLNVYIPQAERDQSPSASTSYRGTPDSGIDEVISVPSITSARVVAIKEPEERDTIKVEDKPPEDTNVQLITESDKANAMRRPASSFTGLRRGQLEGEKLRAERPHTAHVRFKAEDLQTAFEEALKRYQTLPGTPAVVSAETLYKNDGTSFEDNWQTRVIERHTLLRLQKEIRAQSAAQRRQAFEVIKQDRQSTKLFPSRCDSAIGGFSQTGSSAPTIQRAHTSMSVPISYGYGAGSVPSTAKEKVRPKTANPALEKQQMIKNELSQEKPFRYRLNKNAPPVSRPASSRSVSTVADFSPHWIDPRNPDAWRPKSSRSIPSKCNRYVLVNKPKEKLAAPVPSPLEEQLLIERFPKMGSRVVPSLPDPPTPRVKKSYSLEYSPFVYQRYV